MITLVCVFFSILNFFPQEEAKAGGMRGVKVYWPDGTYKGCEDVGTECDIKGVGVFDPIE